jgi:hypothetical protein
MARIKRLPFWTEKLSGFFQGKAGEDGGRKPAWQYERKTGYWP